MRFFFLQTFGCRLNQAESQNLEEALIKRGLRKTIHADRADLAVINSCVVTEKAEREVRQAVYRIKRQNPRAKIVVAGCWADKIKRFGGRRPKGIELVVGNEDKWNRLIENLKIKNQNYNSKFKIFSDTRRLVKIQSGCSNNCSFCMAKLVRGKPVSVPVDKVIEQVNEAVKDGALEIVLTGQNVSQYNDNGRCWIDLVEEVLKETDVKLLRLGSVNPTIMEHGCHSERSEESSESVERNTTFGLDSSPAKRGQNDVVVRLATIYKKIGKNRLARHLHLSLQSGSDRILKLMGRDYTTDQYFDLILNLKSQILNLNLTTDMIVGFPGETEKDFQKTLNFCKKIGFGKIHIFRYSTRPGTLAAEREKEWGEIDTKTKIERAKRLAKLEKELRLDFWKSQIGETAMAIVWKNGRGLSDNYIPITFKHKKNGKLPKIVKIKFLDLNANSVISVQQ